MKKIILCFSLIVAASSAQALDGYVSRDYTCQELQSIVNRDGEITILHRIGSMTFYSRESRCDEFPWHARAVKGYEPSSDMHRCFVGWECIIDGF